MPIEIKSQSLHETFNEAASTAFQRLHADASVIFLIKNGKMNALMWDGCDPGDLQINTTRILEECKAGDQSALKIHQESDTCQEFGLLLQKLGQRSGWVFPLRSANSILGMWLIASKNELVWQADDDFLFRKLAENISLTLQRDQLSTENLRHVSEADAIYEISMEITQLLDLDRVLEVIVEKTCSLLNAEISYIALADEEEKVVRVRVIHGARGEELYKVMHKYGDGVGGWVAANRTPLLVDNYYKEVETQSTVIPGILETEGIISAICVPMSTHRGLVGVLYATSRQEAAFNHAHLELLQALGNHAAIAIENARLYAEQRLSAEKLRNNISTHERLLSLVLSNQGVQVITDTLSELVKCPVIVENNHFQILCWSSKGFSSTDPKYRFNPQISSRELWPDIESTEWFKTLLDTKHSVRGLPPFERQDSFARVITPIVRGNTILGYISAVEVEQPLTDQQRSAVEEASIIFALEFVKQETARASMLQHLIAAQEDERKRIARELHDETSQALTALMLGLDTVSMDITTNPEKANQRLAATKSIADAMLENIHRLISDLRPSLLDDLGLLPAIAWYSEQRLKPFGIAFNLENKGLDQRLSSAMEIALYRIVQEAITNTIRHAHASMVTVRLFLQGNYLTLHVEDDGQGFDPQILQETDMPVRSIGLWGIQERVSILKGDFHVRTAPGAGTRLEIRVPVTQVEMANDYDTRTSG
ncbi:MAG: GAF domain-containing protein [Chloroflexi bacterium]|nr:GAF domain-containing protein [Chloroflexota bacterium]